MSVLLAYCMVPFIKLFGFNTVTVRLPMVLISFGAVALVYLVGRKLFSERIALVAMLLTAVNPLAVYAEPLVAGLQSLPAYFPAGILFTASWIGKTTLFILVHGLFRTDHFTVTVSLPIP